MLSTLKEKVDNMQEQTGDTSRKKRTFKKNQKEMLEIKITVTEMKNAFSGLNIAEETISELEDRAIETFQLKCKEKKE